MGWADAAATGRENTAHTSTAMASQASHCSLEDSRLRCAHRVADVFGRSSSDPATLMADVVVLSSTKESRCVERAKTAYVKHKEGVMGRRNQHRTRGTCVFYRPLLTGHDDPKLLATRRLRWLKLFVMCLSGLGAKTSARSCPTRVLVARRRLVVQNRSLVNQCTLPCSRFCCFQ